jgi:uncharacterized protein YqgC (DUF456 family)
MAQYGIGAGAGGLTGYGMDQEKEAVGLLGQSADAESKRNIANQQANLDRKAGNAKLGATLGSAIGMVTPLGPVGSIVGGLLGGGLGSLF